MASAPVHLSALACEAGRPVPLAELADPVVRDVADLLAEEGIECCRVAEATPVALAGTSATATLEASREDPDAVIFCSDTPAAEPPGPAAWRLVADLGLAEVPVLRVGGGECGNLGLGLRVARSLLLAEGLGSVLVVTADRAVGDTRYLPESLTVLSDGAASCLVTAAPTRPGFVLRGLAATAKADARQAAGMGAARNTVGGIAQATRRLLTDTGTTPERCRHLVMPNYGRSVRGVFAAATGVSRSAVRTPLARDGGHCFSADVLMTLDALGTGGELVAGDLLLLLVTGSRGWTVLLAEYAA
jgi:3-oxoacyl-[acyl-carrier-protein] synthase-3